MFRSTLCFSVEKVEKKTIQHYVITANGIEVRTKKMTLHNGQRSEQKETKDDQANSNNDKEKTSRHKQQLHQQKK